MLAPNRLWSMWDMKRLLVRHVTQAAAQLERVDGILAVQDMNKHLEDKITTQLRNMIAGNLDGFVESVEAMGAPVTAKIARSALKDLRKRKKEITVRELGVMSAEISKVMRFELEEVVLYCLSEGAERYYNPTEPLFSEEVDARMPKASEDVREAGKCFAVGRYTACVFHLMRAMEAAIQVISSRLGIEKVEREWGKLLSDIGAKIAAMPKSDDKNEWSAAHANLYHVKQAWRNDTMHPKRTYTEEEAREVFEAMRAFMRHLASMLPVSEEELMA